MKELEFEIGNYLDFIKAMLAQLQHFQRDKRRRGLVVNQHLKRDIEGYQQIIAKNSQYIAEKFLDIKREARESGRKFPDNMAVIYHMKVIGIWDESHTGSVTVK